MSKTEFTAEEFNALGEESLWPRFLLFPTFAVVGYVCFISGMGGDSLIVRLSWSLFLGCCWACLAGSFHESVHQTMGRWRNANIWFGRVVGTILWIPYSAYRETHIRHHAYMNTPDDFELWPYSKPGASLTFRRIFVLCNILGAAITEPIVYGRIYFSRKSPLSKQARKTIRMEYIGMLACWVGLGLLLGILHSSGAIDLRRFDLLWLLPLQIAAAINAFRKFVEHIGMESTEPLLGTRTILGDNILTRVCSYFNFDLDIHGPHHRYPKLPHFELESKLAEYQEKHPGTQVPIFKTYRAAVLNTLPCLWRNPGVGVNAIVPSGDRVHASTLQATCKPLLPPGIDNFTSEVVDHAAATDANKAA